MLGKLVAMLIAAYVGLRICVAIIPLITDIDISSLGSGIVYDIMGVALWLLPVSAVAGLVIWGANMISPGSMPWNRKKKDEDA